MMSRLPFFLVFMLFDFTTFLFSANAYGAHQPCPSGWLTFRGSRSCYRRGGISKSWMDSRKACFAIGGDLVKIRSAQENSYVALLARTIPNHHNGVWIGLVGDKNNKFTWVDGNPLSGKYSNWRSGEPNSGVEECGEMTLTIGFKWNDLPCLFKIPRAYVCEMERSMQGM